MNRSIVLDCLGMGLANDCGGGGLFRDNGESSGLAIVTVGRDIDVSHGQFSLTQRADAWANTVPAPFALESLHPMSFDAPELGSVTVVSWKT